MKKAIILFNLGGPDKLENVEPFLFNLFYDPAILNIPPSNPQKPSLPNNKIITIINRRIITKAILEFYF